jgi:hypothetical protein
VLASENQVRRSSNGTVLQADSPMNPQPNSQNSLESPAGNEPPIRHAPRFSIEMGWPSRCSLVGVAGQRPEA